jgi:hypothetical protein
MQKIRPVATSLALLLLLAVAAPAPAYAWPFGKTVHLHPGTGEQAAQVTIQLFNKGTVAQDVKVADQVYTVKPHASVTIKAAAGTEITAASSSEKLHEGDLLYTLTPKQNGNTVSFN